MGVIAAAFGIQAALRLHAEESAPRLEAVLATATGRIRWALGLLSVAVLGPVVLTLVFGLAVGAAHAAQTGATSNIGAAMAGELVQLPAIWVSSASSWRSTG